MFDLNATGGICPPSENYAAPSCPAWRKRLRPRGAPAIAGQRSLAAVVEKRRWHGLPLPRGPHGELASFASGGDITAALAAGALARVRWEPIAALLDVGELLGRRGERNRVARELVRLVVAGQRGALLRGRQVDGVSASHRELADGLHASVRTVRRAVDDLVAHGVLDVVPAFESHRDHDDWKKSHASRRANGYRIAPERWFATLVAPWRCPSQNAPRKRIGQASRRALSASLKSGEALVNSLCVANAAPASPGVVSAAPTVDFSKASPADRSVPFPPGRREGETRSVSGRLGRELVSSIGDVLEATGDPFVAELLDSLRIRRTPC